MIKIEDEMIAFGPVPSRRLGRSLGINNIPPKSCSYSCIYCQVGSTVCQEIEPRVFYEPELIAKVVSQQVNAAQNAGEIIDYLTFVPDGEPTLDINLGKAIDLLFPLGIKIAVISNASLIWREDVRQALQKADWVSLKVDTVDERIWRQINQPHRELRLLEILQGIQRFAESYQGILSTETMLVAGINDDPRLVAEVSKFLETIEPHTAYLAAPIRPPAQSNVHVPSEDIIVQAYEMLKAKLKNIQYLIGYEGDSFSSTGDPIRDLLAITAVHPMREEAVRQFLSKTGCDWSFIQDLLAKGKLKEVQFAGKRFYVRSIKMQ
ncbi:MAG: radical SAM protein [Gammaproteobacteria bacterium]|jgi:wyosine [tRNA(Phe)-imidazoG37] synthetase (radical SAM superfamily)